MLKRSIIITGLFISQSASILLVIYIINALTHAVGGASGIGKALATHFASCSDATNTHVTIFDIDSVSCQDTVNSICVTYPSASISFETCDVSSWDSLATAFENVYKTQGRVDHVCANAGITEKGSLMPQQGEEKPTKPDLRTVDVNFLGVIYSVKLAIFYIMKNDLDERNSRGGIICTASNAGLYAFSVAPIYAATKHAVVGLVRSMQRHLDQQGIRINAIAPSVIETNIAPDKALFASMVLTPVSTAASAVDRFVEDPSLSGKVAELHEQNITFAKQQEYVDENTRSNIEMFWTLGYA